MNQEWEKFGKDIRNTIDNAVNSQDFQKLNQNIKDTVNEAINEVHHGIKGAGDILGIVFGETDVRGNKTEIKTSPVKRQELFAGTGSTKAAGIVLTVLGAVLSGGTGFIIFLTTIMFLIEGLDLAVKAVLVFFLPLFAGSMFMLWKGRDKLGSVKRFQRYIGSLQGRTYCNIADISADIGQSTFFVIKDLQKMIRKGWFKEGHLDDEKTCLMVTHSTYREYQSLKKQRLELKNKLLKEQKQEAPKSEVERVLEEGNRYLKQIRACNDAIPGEEISEKISRIETLVQRIFDRVKEDVDSLDDIEKLMEYYLPTTVKLLEAYRQLNDQPVQGENIRASKQEIEKTLDTLNVAFEKLLDSLFEDVAWDVSSDISVLHTMLAQEGLTNRDFENV